MSNHKDRDSFILAGETALSLERKRRRTDDSNHKNAGDHAADDDPLWKVLTSEQGNNDVAKVGMSTMNDEETRAQRRREERRKRLERAQERMLADESRTALQIQEATRTSGGMVERSDAAISVRLERVQEEPKAAVQKEALGDNEENEDDDNDDDFDMFSSSVSPVTKQPQNGKNAATTTDTTTTNTTETTETQQQHRKSEDVQDAEGYYKAVLGETMAMTATVVLDNGERESTHARFKVLGVVGKGVFSTVLKCSVVASSLSGSSVAGDTVSPLPKDATVALKMIRNNETMAKAAQNEVRFLQKLQGHGHVVSLLLPSSSSSSSTQQQQHLPIEHFGHVVLVFPFVPYNLRDVLKKFGKGIGLSLKGVTPYFYQLLSALRHLSKHNIIHADLKPDNILVTADFGTCLIADFGSAMEIGSTDANLPTPYLVSRYYRAPEIMLGLNPQTPAVDLWSIAVTVAELFTGKVLFTGRSNNEMLHAMMERLGCFAHRTLRQHQVALTKHAGIVPHFDVQKQSKQFVFLQQQQEQALVIPDTAPEHNTNVMMITKEVLVSSLNFPVATKTLARLFLQAKSPKDSRFQVQQFADLLSKCLTLEPTKRIGLKDAMHHPLFRVDGGSGASSAGASGAAAPAINHNSSNNNKKKKRSKSQSTSRR